MAGMSKTITATVANMTTVGGVPRNHMPGTRVKAGKPPTEHAKIYDFDPAWDVPDGADNFGDYVVRAIDYVMPSGALMLRTGLQSRAFELVPLAEAEERGE
jgi:hypothetical protein